MVLPLSAKRKLTLSISVARVRIHGELFAVEMPGRLSGAVMPGRRAGSVSLRLMVLLPHCFAPFTASTLFGCSPLMAPAAAKSTVPLAAGERVRLPAILMSPEKDVARRVPGMSAATVPNGVKSVSARRNQGCERAKVPT